MPNISARGTYLDDYIRMLQELRAEHGNVECWDNGGSDYPEAAGRPRFVEKGHAYRPNNVIVLS